jgi:uncharacterized protein (DUF2141 family)
VTSALRRLFPESDRIETLESRMTDRHWTMLKSAVGLAMAGAPLLPSAAIAADLEVTAHRVAPGPGEIRFILYRGADGFRHEDKAFKILSLRAGTASVSVMFRDLPPGHYAVMAYHDANGDQKLDLRFGMFPKEGWGLSNNPKVMGPPSFGASSFAVADQNQSIGIEMHY